MPFALLVWTTINVICMKFSLYTSMKHMSLNVKPISNPHSTRMPEVFIQD